MGDREGGRKGGMEEGMGDSDYSRIRKLVIFASESARYQIAAPHNLPFVSLWPEKQTGLQSKGSVRDNFCQSFITTACHDDWLTGVWNSL